MLRIVRPIDAGTTTLTMSGRIGSEHLPELRRFVEEERAQNVVLDLVEVSLVKGSHAIYVSQPRAVADLIAKAASSVALATR